MHLTHLRKVGGSVMVTIPPAFLELLNLQPGACIGMTLDGGRLVLEPTPAAKYTLSDLLDQCDASVEMEAEEREWLQGGAEGSELL